MHGANAFNSLRHALKAAEVALEIALPFHAKHGLDESFARRRARLVVTCDGFCHVATLKRHVAQGHLVGLASLVKGLKREALFSIYIDYA